MVAVDRTALDFRNSFTNLDFNKSVFRKYERLIKKKENLLSSVLFNRTCLSEELLPRYGNISMYTGIMSKIFPLSSGS